MKFVSGCANGPAFFTAEHRAMVGELQKSLALVAYRVGQSTPSRDDIGHVKVLDRILQ